MRLSIPFTLSLVLAAGCGDDKKPTTMIDAMKPPIDARPEISLMHKEGGEIRLEWISQGGMTTSRMGAYFYKSMTPGRFDLPGFPGCVDMRARDHWPLAQGTIVPLDVGGVKLIPKTGTPFEMVAAMNPKDAFQRPHELWWQKPSNLPGNDADTFLPPNESYDVEFTGSAEWPHQLHEKAAFMPERWTPTSPDALTPGVLTRDQDFTVTYTPVTSSNLPPNVKVNTFMAFVGTPNIGPIVACQEEGTDGSMTVPAALVNVILDHSGPLVGTEAGPGTAGRFVRQQLTHQLFELTDSDTPLPEDQRKRVDVLTIYCYNNAWTKAP
jgi:hypothetical protein